MRLIKEHERRVELLKIKHQRRKIAQKWLDVLVHRAIYSKVVSVFEDADKARKENELRKAQLLFKSGKASVIQKAARSKLLKDLNGQHWQQVARFAGLMRRNRWRCSLAEVLAALQREKRRARLPAADSDAGRGGPYWSSSAGGTPRGW